MGVCLVLAMAVAACGGSSTNGAHAPVVTPSTGGGQTSSAPAPVTPNGPAVAMTFAEYQYRVSVAAGGISGKTTFTTDDGTGEGGHVVDAPPGQTLIVATLSFMNDSNRPEPFQLAPTGPLPSTDDGAEVVLAVPRADAAAFGLDSTLVQRDCATTADPYLAPAGYCSLDAVVGAFSPASTDITQPPQLAAGASGTLTMFTGGLASPAVPESAPTGEVKVFVEKTDNCSGQPNCWAQVA